MKHTLLALLFFWPALCVGMEEEENNDTRLIIPANPNEWAKKIASCIAKKRVDELETLYKNPPVVRAKNSLNNNILNQLKQRQQKVELKIQTEQESLQGRYSRKKIENKARAVLVDLVMPFAGGAFGLTEGIMADNNLLIGFGTAFLVLSVAGGINQAIWHWNNEETHENIQRLEEQKQQIIVNIALLRNTQNLNQKGNDNGKK